MSSYHPSAGVRQKSLDLQKLKVTDETKKKKKKEAEKRQVIRRFNSSMWLFCLKTGEDSVQDAGEAACKQTVRQYSLNSEALCAGVEQSSGFWFTTKNVFIDGKVTRFQKLEHPEDTYLEGEF